MQHLLGQFKHKQFRASIEQLSWSPPFHLAHDFLLTRIHTFNSLNKQLFTEHIESASSVQISMHTINSCASSPSSFGHTTDAVPYILFPHIVHHQSLSARCFSIYKHTLPLPICTYAFLVFGKEPRNRMNLLDRTFACVT